MPRAKQSMDGNTVAAHVAYALQTLPQFILLLHLVLWQTLLTNGLQLDKKNIFEIK